MWHAQRCVQVACSPVHATCIECKEVSAVQTAGTECEEERRSPAKGHAARPEIDRIDPSMEAR